MYVPRFIPPSFICVETLADVRENVSYLARKSRSRHRFVACQGPSQCSSSEEQGSQTKTRREDRPQEEGNALRSRQRGRGGQEGINAHSLFIANKPFGIKSVVECLQSCSLFSFTEDRWIYMCESRQTWPKLRNYGDYVSCVKTPSLVE